MVLRRVGVVTRGITRGVTIIKFVDVLHDEVLIVRLVHPAPDMVGPPIIVLLRGVAVKRRVHLLVLDLRGLVPLADVLADDIVFIGVLGIPVFGDYLPLVVDELLGFALGDDVEHVQVSTLWHANVLVVPAVNVDVVDLFLSVVSPRRLPVGVGRIPVQGLILGGGLRVEAEVVQLEIAQMLEDGASGDPVQLVEVLAAGILLDTVRFPVDLVVEVIHALQEEVLELVRLGRFGVVVAVLGEGHVHLVVRTADDDLFHAHLLFHGGIYPVVYRYQDGAGGHLPVAGHHRNGGGLGSDHRLEELTLAAGLGVRVKLDDPARLEHDIIRRLQPARGQDVDVPTGVKLHHIDGPRGQLRLGPLSVNPGVELDLSLAPQGPGHGDLGDGVEQDALREAIGVQDHPVNLDVPGEEMHQEGRFHHGRRDVSLGSGQEDVLRCLGEEGG